MDFDENFSVMLLEIKVNCLDFGVKISDVKDKTVSYMCAKNSRHVVLHVGMFSVYIYMLLADA